MSSRRASHESRPSAFDANDLGDLAADLRRSSALVIAACWQADIDHDAVVDAVGATANVYFVPDWPSLNKLTFALRDRRMPVPAKNTVRVYAPHFGELRNHPEDHLVIELDAALAADGYALGAAIRQAALRALRRPPGWMSGQDTRRDPSTPVPKPGPSLFAVPTPVEQPAMGPSAISITSAISTSPVPSPVDPVSSPPTTPIEGLPAEPTTEQADDDATVAFLARSTAAADARAVEAELRADAVEKLLDDALDRQRREHKAVTNSLRNRINTLETALTDTQRAAAERAAALIEELDQARRDLREARSRQRGKTTAKNDSGDRGEDADYPVVYADAEHQARHEIELTYLETVPHYERSHWPMREYTFGPDFLASLDTVNVSRRKALTVAVQIITRRVTEVPGRSTRQFNESDRAGSPPWVRADGAAAWRANITNNTAQAARFLWWEMPDGSVELGKAALHDDTELR